MQNRTKTIIFHISQLLVISAIIATGMPVKADELRWEAQHQSIGVGCLP